MFYSKGKRYYYYYLSTGSAESLEKFILLADKRLYHNFPEIDYLLLRCSSDIQNKLFDIGSWVMHWSSPEIFEIFFGELRISVDSADFICTANPRNWWKLAFLTYRKITFKLKVNTMERNWNGGWKLGLGRKTKFPRIFAL